MRCAQLWRAAIQKPIFRGPRTSARMIASLRTPVSGSRVIVTPGPRRRRAERAGLGDRVDLVVDADQVVAESLQEVSQIERHRRLLRSYFPLSRPPAACNVTSSPTIRKITSPFEAW